MQTNLKSPISRDLFSEGREKNSAGLPRLPKANRVEFPTEGNAESRQPDGPRSHKSSLLSVKLKTAIQVLKEKLNN